MKPSILPGAYEGKSGESEEFLTRGGFDWPGTKCPDDKRHRWNKDAVCNRCGADKFYIRDIKEANLGDKRTINRRKPCPPKQKCRDYCCRYFHDGLWWGLEITAYDHADAAARVAKLGNLQLLGELMMTIPAHGKMNWLPDLICTTRNVMKRLLAWLCSWFASPKPDRINHRTIGSEPWDY